MSQEELKKWAIRGLTAEVEKLESATNKLITDSARDLLVPKIRDRFGENLGESKRAREAFDLYMRDPEYGPFDPSGASEDGFALWLELATASRSYRKPPQGAPPAASAAPAPSAPPAVMNDTHGFLKAIGWIHE